MSNVIDEIEKKEMRKKPLNFAVGDMVRVEVRIAEAGKERLQALEGIVIKRQGGGVRETFTVRRVSQGVGVEWTWPVHSPKIEKVKVLRKGKVKRAKLYYLRKKVGAAATRVEEKEEKAEKVE